MKVYRVKIDQYANPYTQALEEMGAILAELPEMEVGHVMTIECLEMTEEEYAALPEWEGP